MCSMGKESCRDNAECQAYDSYLVWRDGCLYEKPGDKSDILRIMYLSIIGLSEYEPG